MRYVAFISYSHRDRSWAQWLHRRIESYRPPRGMVTTRPLPPLRPLFLDRAELPSSSDLAASVRSALEDSAALIVICSKAAAQSRWVNEEVRAFKALGRGARIFCFVVDGALGSGEAFPPALRYEVQDGVITDLPAAEPLAADVRRGGDDRSAAALKIIAGLLDVPLDSLRQREAARRQRRLALTAALSAAGCVVFAAISVVALRARAEAERESLTARRTADFMKSLFVVSDPSEARGNSVTAREVLDRGVRQVDTQLKNEPLVRADLVTTLGEVLQPRVLSGESRAVERCRPYAGPAAGAGCTQQRLDRRAADAARRVPGSGAGAVAGCRSRQVRGGCGQPRAHAHLGGVRRHVPLDR